MKKINRKQMVATAILVFGIAAAGLGAAYAADNGNGNPMSGVVSAIAKKFNLNEADVQAVFDEQRSKMEVQREQNRQQNQARHQTEFESRLAGLVSAGKLTQAQADAIKAKHSELQSWRDEQMAALKNKTGQERKTAVETLRQEQKEKIDALKRWAAGQGISEEYLPLCGMGGEGRGMGHGRGAGFGGLKSE